MDLLLLSTYWTEGPHGHHVPDRALEDPVKGSGQGQEKVLLLSPSGTNIYLTELCDRQGQL